MVSWETRRLIVDIERGSNKMQFGRMVRTIGRRIAHGTSLDRLIPPEIRNDSLYSAIVRVAAHPGVRHMLEIGSSGGDGSTEAFIEGALKNPTQPTLHCIEVSEVRYQALRKRHASRGFVWCYHALSVRWRKWPQPLKSRTSTILVHEGCVV